MSDKAENKDTKLSDGVKLKTVKQNREYENTFTRVPNRTHKKRENVVLQKRCKTQEKKKSRIKL